MKALAFLPIDLTILAGLVVVGLLTIDLLIHPRLHVTKRGMITALLLVGLVIYISISLSWAGVANGQGRLFRLGTAGIITITYPLLAVGATQWRQRQFLIVLAGAGALFAVSIFIIRGVPNWAPHYIAVARPTGICGVIAFAILTTTNSISRATVALVVAIGCPLLIIVSGSRGPFISLIIGFLFIAVIVHFTPSNNDRTIGRWTSWLSLITPILVTSLMFLMYVGYSTIIPVESLGNVDRFILLVRRGGASVSNRIQLYEASVVMWLDNPASIFFGQGIGLFLSRYRAYPHNIFLELLVTGGLLSFLWFIAALLWSVRGAISRKEPPSFQQIASLGLVAYMLANAQVTGDLYINRYLFVFIGLISLITPSVHSLD